MQELSQYEEACVFFDRQIAQRPDFETFLHNRCVHVCEHHSKAVITQHASLSQSTSFVFRNFSLPGFTMTYSTTRTAIRTARCKMCGHRNRYGKARCTHCGAYLPAWNHPLSLVVVMISVGAVLAFI